METTKKKAGGQIRVQASMRCSGVAVVARRIGCHPSQLSYILHGKRKPSKTIRRRLERMGITTTIDGEML